MYNRAEVIDQNFVKFVREGRFPDARSQTTAADAALSASELMDLFETQVMSRQMDLRARILKEKGECFYTIGSSGHEGNAVWGKTFRLTDMAFVHYRSCAFMIQRAKQLPGATPLYETMLSFVASADDPIAGGRHKVFGSYPLMVPPQTSTIASHLPKAIGAALSIGRARDLKLETAVMPADAVALCTFGDASTNHSTAVGAINSALWVSHQNVALPLVFICEDNGIGISVRTPENWLESQYSERPGLHYISCDGLNLCDLVLKSREAERFARSRKKPVFLHMKTVRLLGHAGSDMETSYSTLSDIEAKEFNDPLLHSARILIEHGVATPEDLIGIYKSVESRVAAIGEYAKTRPKLLKPEEVRASLLECRLPKASPPPVGEPVMNEVFGKEWPKLQQPLHLAKLINMALHETLARYPGAVVFGEDVAQKGGVYNVSDGLWKRFGPRRVFNSPLDEQTILGTAIGFAHNGFLPIPEIQFLAYVHNAEDQLRGEAATLAFFSQGQFTNGMVVRIAGLPYQKGFGGHFHNDNSLAIFRDIPGLIVATPSNGEDAVKMWRTCTKLAWEQGRVVVFVEPIALYMTRDLHEANDKLWTFHYPKENETIEAGQFGVQGDEGDFTIVTYGNGYYYSRQAAKILEEKHNLKAKIIDLRWIAPIDKEKLLAEIGESKKVLIVDECRKTGSLSEFLAGLMAENMDPVPRIKIIAADDCFIPLGKAAAAGLPSRDDIVRGALQLMNRL
ncbi:MAG: thiamine pyrophosphate-dependent enzyme [Bdellovibrionales bacterium]